MHVLSSEDVLVSAHLPLHLKIRSAGRLSSVHCMKRATVLQGGISVELECCEGTEQRAQEEHMQAMRITTDAQEPP